MRPQAPLFIAWDNVNLPILAMRHDHATMGVMARTTRDDLTHDTTLGRGERTLSMPGMIVAPQAGAVDIGASVLEQGGNAVDAAVTTAVAQGVLDPLNCGLGGFGSLTIYWAQTSQCETISFHGRAGSRVTADMWQDMILEEYRDGYGYHLRAFLN